MKRRTFDPLHEGGCCWKCKSERPRSGNSHKSGSTPRPQSGVYQGFRARNVHGLCPVLRAGHYAEVACVKVGIGTSTYFRWLGESEERGGLYREFREAVAAASAHAESKALALIQGTKTAESARWFLERRFSERWGRRDRLETKGTDALGTNLPPPIVKFIYEGSPAPEPEIVDERGEEATTLP